MKNSPQPHFRSLAFLFILLLPLFMQAQEPAALDAVNAHRLQINRTGMTILGGWAVGNMAFSGVQFFRTSGATKNFHQMNIWWNAVNLGLATVSYLGASPESGLGLGLSESVAQQHSIEKILLFNAGLDVGYIMTGAFMRERSRNASAKWAPRLKGWGNSLMLQGGFLFLFDVGMVIAHTRHANAGIMKVLETVQLGPGTVGVDLQF